MDISPYRTGGDRPIAPARITALLPMNFAAAGCETHCASQNVTIHQENRGRHPPAR
jgi:hypothetical protein